MMLSGMKTCVPLLWGLCLLLSVESMTTSRPETSTDMAAELNSTTRPTTAHAKTPQSATLSPTHRYAEVSTASAPQTTPLLTATETKDAMRTEAAANPSSKSLSSTAETTAKTEARPSPAETTAASKSPHSPTVTTSANAAQHSPAVTTAPGAAQPSRNTTNADATKTVAHLSRQPSTSSFMTTPAAASVPASAKPESASEFASTSMQNSAQTGLTSSKPTSSTATNSSPTSEEAPYHRPTNSETSTSRFNSATSIPISSSPFPSSTSDSPSSTTAGSNSSAGIFYPRAPKRLPLTTTTVAPNEASKSIPTIKPQPCSTRSVEKRCLIIIAVLAAVATIFMVSTIVLCTKLSARKYKVRRPAPATEMMCISSLLPERNHTYTRQRNPIMNGVLVYPGGGDSDEDGGDNLTLSSFLPENDRYV